MKLLLNDLWPTITTLARKSKNNHIAVAYLGQGANELLPLRRGNSLVIDMSEGTVKNGQTDPKEVEKYLKKGVSVYTCQNLHAKAYIFDKTLIIASANVSRRSKTSLVESGLLCRSKEAVARACNWIRRLHFKPVTQKYVEHCKELYRPPRVFGVRGKARVSAWAQSRRGITGVRAGRTRQKLSIDEKRKIFAFCSKLFRQGKKYSERARLLHRRKPWMKIKTCGYWVWGVQRCLEGRPVPPYDKYANRKELATAS